MERVPPQVKGVARTALLRYAIEQGHTVITNKVIDEAMAIFMPARMAEKMRILAEDLAVAKLRAEAQVATAICSVCGYTVKGPNPVVTCPVCKASADKFQVISREAVETIATQEGGIEEATGRLGRVPAGFMRDMTREEVERVATEKGATTIDLALCEEGIGHARQTMNEVIAGYVSSKKPR